MYLQVCKNSDNIPRLYTLQKLLMCVHSTLSLAQNCTVDCEHYAHAAFVHGAGLDQRWGKVLDAN